MKNNFIFNNIHYKLFNESKTKVLIFVLVVFASILELFGLSLIYPLISVFFELGSKDTDRFLQYLHIATAYIGIPSSRNYLILYIVLILFLKSLFLICYRYVTSKSVLMFMVSLRKRLYFGIFDAEFGFAFDKKSRFINALTIQSNGAISALQMQYVILQHSISLMGLIVLGLIVSWKVLLVSVCMGVFVFLIMRFTVKYAKTLGKMLSVADEELFQNINQGLNQYRYLKSVTAYDRLFNDFRPILNKIYQTQLRFVLMNRGTQILTEPIIIMVLSIILVLGITLFHIEIGALILMYVILGRLYSNLIGLINDFQNYSKDLISTHYCYDLVDEVNKNFEEHGGGEWERLKTDIQIMNLSFGHDGDLLFNGLNLIIPHSKITVIYGKSGAGKSTLLNIIMGLIKAEAGSIIVDSADINAIDLKSFRNNIGLVIQDSAVFNLSVKENLSLRNPLCSDETLIKYLEAFDLNSIFPGNKIDLDYKIDESSSNLSGGEKQRLALIRELVSEPDILILDEVTSSLDEQTMQKIISYVGTLKNKMTIIIVTHQKEYYSIADYIYEIKNGIAILTKDLN